MAKHVSPVFIDWLTASQRHPLGGLPIILSGLVTWHDREGNCRLERTSPATVGGSFGTGVRVGCDGARVFLSGNVGRFSRKDNLFNLDWAGTLAAANRILLGVGLPPFSAGGPPDSEGRPTCARVHRLDITANYSAGSEAQSRAVIRWLGVQSIARMKRGQAGDESVWWANTRHMLKAYLKGPEMIKHGSAPDEFIPSWCRDNGIVRVEVEIKRRLLQELGLDRIDAITDEKLLSLFNEQTQTFRKVDRSEDPDLLTSIPSRYRMTAAAWLAGHDVLHMFCRATAFNHARVLREYGIDIFSPRNIERFPVRVRVVDLQPLSVPDWYDFKVA